MELEDEAEALYQNNQQDRRDEEFYRLKLWRSHAFCALGHITMIIFIASYLYDEPAFETYELIVPFNATAIGDPYVAKSMLFYVQAALCAIHAISAFAHVFTLLIFDAYMTCIRDSKTTPIRWTEYAVSAPLMIITIGVMCGIRDRYALVSLAGLIFAVILCGSLMQHIRRERANPLSLTSAVCFVAFVLLVVAYVPIWVSYSNYDAPDFVTAIIFTMSISFASFGFVPVIAIVYGKSIRFEEFTFNKLSLTSKILLGMLLAFGLRSRRD